ncbi:MAG: Clp1/GlmU family protein [Crenarchaeota archaeon]|nr:Clp1/GlmU family protein [Thermoproteota archaeon]MDW8033602.1 Clp1/GlmU family protein [Nitrososphaerota archaeon]
MKRIVRNRITLRIGKTLIVDGPATVQIAEGMVNVMGTVFAEGSTLKVRRFRRTPFYAEYSDTSLVVDGKKYQIVEGSTIPSSWIECAEKTAGDDAKLIAIIGGTDSGKTSLATFLVNYYLNFQGEVGIVDGDPGQNDLGVPGTVSAGIASKGLSDLCQVKPEIIEFIGLTAPETVAVELNESIARIVKRLMQRGVRKIVLNTDGWVSPKGLKYKAELMNMVKPYSIISLLGEEEYGLFAGQIDRSLSIIRVESTPYVRKRSRTQRRLLRILNYKRYFIKSRLVGKSISEVMFMNHPFINGELTTLPENIGKNLEPLEVKSYMGGTYVKIRGKLEEPVVTEAGGSNIILLGEDWERGLLVGLARGNSFLGVGIIESLTDKEVVIKTPLASRFDSIKLGEIKLDSTFNEKSFHWMHRNK